MFRVLFQNVEIASAVESALADFETTTRPARARQILQVAGEASTGLSVYHDCARLAHDAPMDAALAATVAGLNAAAIEACPYFSVHSGVVASDTGSIALPAESGQGKTTLTAAMVRAGFDYLSDEALVLDDDGAVLPYPKPFALSEWSAAVLGLTGKNGETLVTADVLGGRTRREPSRLSDVVIAEYGHDQPSIEEVAPSRAVSTLIGLSFNHYKDPERAFRIATGVAREVRVWELRYDDPMAAADLLSAKLG